MAVFSAERMQELDTVLGPEQRDKLLTALATQAADARVALRRHHDAGDERQLRRDIHRLKGAAQIVGADDLIATLRGIEACEPGLIDTTLLDTADTRIAAVVDAAVRLQQKT